MEAQKEAGTFAKSVPPGNYHITVTTHALDGFSVPREEITYRTLPSNPITIGLTQDKQGVKVRCEVRADTGTLERVVTATLDKGDD